MSCLAFAGPVPNPETTCATPTGAGGREKPECSLPSQGEGQGAASPQGLAPLACPRSPGTEAPRVPSPGPPPLAPQNYSRAAVGSKEEQASAQVSTSKHKYMLPKHQHWDEPTCPWGGSGRGWDGDRGLVPSQGSETPERAVGVQPPQPLSSVFPVAPAPAGVTPGIYRPSLLPAPPGPFVTGNGRCVK